MLMLVLMCVVDHVNRPAWHVRATHNPNTNPLTPIVVQPEVMDICQRKKSPCVFLLFSPHSFARISLDPFVGQPRSTQHEGRWWKAAENAEGIGKDPATGGAKCCGKYAKPAHPGKRVVMLELWWVAPCTRFPFQPWGAGLPNPTKVLGGPRPLWSFYRAISTQQKWNNKLL